MSGKDNGSSPNAPIQFRFRIRNFMIFNLYLVVLLTGVSLVARTSGKDREFALLGAGIGMPIIMAFLSAVVIRPGPSKNFLTIFFFGVSSLVLATWSSQPILLVGQFFLFNPSNYSQSLKILSPKDWLLITLLPGFYWWGALMFFSTCFPRRCPVCHRRALIKAKTVRHALSCAYTYYGCAACGSQCKRSKNALVVWDDASSSKDNPF